MTKHFLLILVTTVFSLAALAQGDLYQLKVYHCKTPREVTTTGHYLEYAFLPAMHKAGIKTVGVFTGMESDTSGTLIYVLIPYRNFTQITEISAKLLGDKQYTTSGIGFLDAAYNDAPYTRMETILLSAFPKMLSVSVPQLTAAKTDRVYELRSYESPTEKLNSNKVTMFNDGNEVALFKRLGFNAVFYAEVIAGSHMPNLMYLTAFNSKADRDKHWDTFSNDPEWKALSSRPEYQHNVSKADIIFLRPTAYSDL